MPEDIQVLVFEERAAGGPSLRPVAARLGELLGRPVSFAADVAGPEAEETVFSLGDEDVAVLENVRFEPAETSKDDAKRGAFARQLARFGELYVDDAFGAVHRKHASVYDLPPLLPHAAGDLVREEVSVLRQLTTDPGRPFVVVLGGKKPSDKLAVIGNLLGLADRILIGGGMGYTFLAAQGYEVGHSVLEADQIPFFQLFVLRAVATLRRKPFTITWHEVWSRSYWRDYLGAGFGRIGWWIQKSGRAYADRWKVSFAPAGSARGSWTESTA